LMRLRPIAPLAIAFIAGLVFAGYSGLPGWQYAGLLFLSLLPLVAAVFKRFEATPLLAVPCFFFLGALFLGSAADPDFPPGHITEYSNKGVVRVYGVITGLPDEAGPDAMFYVRAERVFSDGAWEKTSGGIAVVSHGSAFRAGNGDRIIFAGRVKEIRNFGNPGEFDYRGRFARSGIFVRAYIKDGLIVKVREGRGFLNAFSGLRERFNDFIDASGAANRGVIKALLIGERNGIAAETNDAFISTGTAHVLSVSGLHVGFVAWISYAAVFWLLRRSRRVTLAINAKKFSLALSILPVVAYAVMSGFSVPTQRAAIMVAVFVLAMLSGKVRDIYSAIALAALAVLAASPGSLWDVSFLLSFAAVISMAYLVPELNSWFFAGEESVSGIQARFLRKVMVFLTVSLAAILGTYPLSVYYFNGVSAVALVANIVAVPVTAAAVPVGLISFALLPVWHGGAEFMMRFAGVLAGFMVWVMEFMSSFEYSYLRAATPTLLEIAIFYCGLACLPRVRKSRLAVFVFMFSMAAFAAVFGWSRYVAMKGGDLKVTFISVGQGDGALIEFPEYLGQRRKFMLIDAGGFYGGDFDTGKMIVAPFLWDKRITKIDYAVLSHAQRDHMGGLPFIVENFSPDEFWWNGMGRLDPKLIKAIGEKSVKVNVVRDETPDIEINGVKVEFLNLRKGSNYDINDVSMVLRLTKGTRSFLFTGDIGIKREAALLSDDISADVIKVPHHGSKTSSSESFIKKVNPSVAVVSSGFANPFGMPGGDVTERYVKAGATIYRTDMNGAVIVTTDGKDIAVLTGHSE